MRIRKKYAASLVLPISATLVMSFISAAQPADAGASPSLPHKTIAGAVTKDGRPLRGASVEVSIWPSEESLRKLKKGDRVNFWTLPVAFTDSSGRYGVDIPWGALPADYIDASGGADIQISANDGIQSLHWQTPLSDPVTQTRAMKSMKSKVRHSPNSDVVRFDLGRQPGVGDQNALISNPLTLVQKTPQGLAHVASQKVFRETGFHRTGVAQGCVTSAGNFIYNVQEKWGRIFSPAAIPTDVTETNASSHTLGVGFQNTAKVWSATGTTSMTVTSSGSGGYTGLWNEYLYNRLNYRDYPCTFQNGTTQVTRRVYDTSGKVTDTGGWAGAMPTSWAANPSTNPCYKRGAGWYYTKLNATNTTFSGGVNLGPLTVSSQAGWDSSTSIKWGTIPAGMTALECGSGPGGPESSQSAEMGLG